MNRLPVVLFLLCCSIFSNAQLSYTNTHPQGYFRNPMNFPLDLSANFGELRSNHWHMGLDIRTQQKENKPVYAAAEGYIAFVGIRPQSFGRFIIIHHPNGYSTLYAHLNDFAPALEKYVTDKQYEKESWALELDIPENEFPVKKGDFIAYSGNTGASRGAHLHFEIFDTKTGSRFNPLLFGFDITDTKPPVATRLALYDRTKSVYEQSAKMFTLKKTADGYVIPKMDVLKVNSPKISLAVSTQDLINNGSFNVGIYAAELYVDNQFVSGFLLDDIDYTETRCMNAQIDYRTKINGGPYLQHLTPLPGDLSRVYRTVNTEGAIVLNDTSVHDLSIRLLDVYNNSSVIRTKVQYIPLDDSPTYFSAPLTFIPNQENTVTTAKFKLHLPAKAIYDTIKTRHAVTSATSSIYVISETHSIGESDLPLQQSAQISILTNNIPDEWKSKVVIKQNGRGTNFKKAIVQGNWASTSFISWGTYQALVDVQAPTLNEIGKGDTVIFRNSNSIVFTPRDNTEVASFRAEIDGQWIRFTNDKSSSYIYTFDDRVPYGVHHLKVTVTDIVGNTTVKDWWIKREPYVAPVKKAPAKKSSSKKVTTKKTTTNKAPVKKAPAKKSTTTKKKK